jgi:hypothetical protein
MSFRDYIRTRRVTDTPAGDFTADAKADANLPAARTGPELKSYLEARGAISDAVKAAHVVWAA